MTTLRTLYMGGHLSHEDYYGFLAEVIKPPIPVPISRIAESTDPHLNDISLEQWDLQHYEIKRLARKTGLFESWSLSESVCVAKVYARYLASQL